MLQGILSAREKVRAGRKGKSMGNFNSRFAGRTALITGGASGIGLATAQRMAAEGAALFLADIDGEGAAAAAAGITEEFMADSSARVLSMAVDVTDAAAVEAMTGRCADELGGPDILVASAGIGGSSPISEMPLELWERVLAVNLTGTMLCTREASLRMMEKGWGRIIHLASIVGQRGVSGRAAYGASKGGVIALMQSAAVDLAPHGITVNAMCPGPIDTPLVKKHHTPSVRAQLNAVTPAGRYGEAGEVASAICFLASEEAGYITGLQFNIDGGYGATGAILKE